MRPLIKALISVVVLAIAACADRSPYEPTKLTVFGNLAVGLMGSHGQMHNGCTPPCRPKAD